MNSFDKLMPTINPRRYLKLIDRMETVISEDDLKKIIGPTFAKVMREKESPVALSWSNSIGGMQTGAGVLEQVNFLRRFFTELRRIQPAMLVQPMDDDIHCTFGIFIQTKTAKSWSEYEVLSDENKKVVDKIIDLWKATEDEMRDYCLAAFGNSITHGTMQALDNQALDNLYNAIVRCDNIANTIREWSAAGTATDTVDAQIIAFNELSVRYVSVLNCTDALEKAMIAFCINLKSVLNIHGLSGINIAEVSEIPTGAINFTEACSKDLYSSRHLHLLDLDRIPYPLANRIRNWFIALGLTPRQRR